MTRIVFVTGNQSKYDEVARLLAGVEVVTRKLDFQGREGDLADVARARAIDACRRLGEPCFVEVTTLALEGMGSLSGAELKKRLLQMGEAAFFQAHGGRRARSRVVVGYAAHPDAPAAIFEGETEGTLLREGRGEAGYGWDRAFVPDGYARTLGEMGASKWLLNMRYRPYLELRDRLVERTLGGTYEAHVTVAARDEDGLRSFGAACGRLGVKHLQIELARGEARFQPMTASYHHGTLAEVRAEVDGIARVLAAEGFDVTRVKIEAVGDNHDIPRTDADARDRRGGYFEFHVKVAVPPDGVAELGARCEREGAHLSRNAQKALGGGREARFVTLRVPDVGRAAAEARFAALLASLAETGLPLTHRLREYTVYDSNVDLDRGWLPAAAERG